MKIRQRTVCHTCRGRKLGCDGKVPACSQCLRTGRPCGGYQYDLIFVGPSLPTKPKPKHNRCRIRQRPKEPDARTTSNATIAGGLSWQEDDLLLLVSQSFIPAWPATNERPMKLRSTSRVCGAWMDKVLELDATGDEGKALRDAIEAFGIAIVSQTAPQVASAADALDAHGTALSSILGALRRCQTSRPNELSSAMMFLFLSEFLLPSASSARFHAIGLSQLMLGQGPSYYSSGLPHELFLGFRTGMIVWSIAAHKSIFLGSPEWSTIPFQERPPEPLQALVTVGARIPSILETIDKMNAPIDLEKALECLDLLKNVMTSLADWDSVHSASALLQQGYDLNEESVSTHDILYHDVTEANSVMHYLTFRVICAVHARSLHNKLAGAQPLPVELAIPESIVTENAASIMQSIGYLTQEQMRLYGGMSALLPFKVSHEYLERYGGPDHQALCKRVVNDVKTRRHFYLINFLHSDSILGTHTRCK